MLVSLVQANKDARESHEKAQRKRFQAQQREEIGRLVAEEKAKRSAVLIEWERTYSPPQWEEVCLLILFILSLLTVVMMFMYFIIYVADLSSEIRLYTLLYC